MRESDRGEGREGERDRQTDTEPSEDVMSVLGWF